MPPDQEPEYQETTGPTWDEMPEGDPDAAPDEFAAAFGEPLSRVLDLSTWTPGSDLAQLYSTLREAVAESVEQARRTRVPIREAVLKALKERRDPLAPESAGFYQMTAGEVAEVHRSLLFNGATECCDGTIQAHDSLLLSAFQIGLAIVSYQGNQGTWVHRLYQRDLRARFADPLQEALQLLDRSERRGSARDEGADPVSRLARRGLMEYAERAALAHLSKAPWRMGHGHPVPFNMLAPSSPEMTKASLEVLRELILGHQQFLFVPSEPGNRLLQLLGNALNPLEFAIVETLQVEFPDERLHALEQARLGHSSSWQSVLDFIKEVGPQVVTGVYRAGEHSPPQVFYAHRDHVFKAAALAIADSALLPYRGFPMLITLADSTCSSSFDSSSFKGSVHDAYAAAGEPARYLGERETRR